MKLWIDDLRPAPPGYLWAKSSDAAIANLWNTPVTEPVEEVSFDHDLGGEDTTRPVMLWMIENDVWPEHIHVHTANPVGREWLVKMAWRYAPEETGITS